MKVTKVVYTVKADYVEKNEANIRAVMDALRARPIEGLTYFAARGGNGRTFMHVVVARDEACQARLTDMSEFVAFQSALRESGPEAPPAPEDFDLVAAGFES